ncbi:hypothetical protein NIES267_17960 [Calothrix parasitica NIES-267]|uniref:Uncharacterized protein n=1 Tax=Calothrix parasitica NIES-267 TaxID=1973488 RepID=A0A1Z4LM53_9CYAN|nr:hypothetical protein NIES267_17960 [Calothrix parasitica NIES-267]
MKLSVEMQSQLIVTCTKDLTHLKYGSLSKWSLYNNFTVKYEWHCPEKDNHRKQEIAFENLPLEIQILIAKKAIKSPLLKTLDDEKQLMLVHLAVMNNQ